jgi:hypothetical protein
VSFAARALEDAGIATVVMGCARDIVERAACARFVFSDFPLGNAAGTPHDARHRTRRSSWPLAPRARGRAANDGAIDAAVERGCELEARLLQRRAAIGGGNHAPTREFDRQKETRAAQGCFVSSVQDAMRAFWPIFR